MASALDAVSVGERLSKMRIALLLTAVQERARKWKLVGKDLRPEKVFSLLKVKV